VAPQPRPCRKSSDLGPSRSSRVRYASNTDRIEIRQKRVTHAELRKDPPRRFSDAANGILGHYRPDVSTIREGYRASHWRGYGVPQEWWMLIVHSSWPEREASEGLVRKTSTLAQNAVSKLNIETCLEVR
jgi:hypothetical protein